MVQRAAPRVISAVLPEFETRDRLPAGRGAAEQRAREILEGAERDAQRMMEGAQQKAAALLEEARREGELQGRAEALAAAHEAVAAALHSLGLAAERLQRLEAEMAAVQETVILDLALALAGRILGSELARDPGRLLPVIRAAVGALPEPGPAVVRVHPAVAEVVGAQRSALAPTEAAGLTIVADAGLPLDGCVVESGATTLDASLQVQLAEAGRRMREEPW